MNGSHKLYLVAYHGVSKKLDDIVYDRLGDRVGSAYPGQYIFYGGLSDFVKLWNDKFLYYPDQIYITEHSSFNQR